ncbi:sugar phosphate isomerase/epimerase family protein [Aureimonas ureilytica]|uniref:sugar phosphate isomerase/epimerase family protein n=1 Tax=Aureimonas ureilytica TaxID=401562 RepID=UPI00037D5279|nr:sugar phosphate isomerase/epimerase [Aureimonas ureilytica]
MKLGIFAKTFPGSTPETVLAATRSAGFRAVQYNMACSGFAAMPDAIERDTALRVARAAREAGLEIVAVSGTYNMIHPDRSVREAGLRRLEVLASRASEMGTRLVTLCTGTRDPEDQWREHPGNHRPDAWRDLLEAMEAAIAIAERHDVDLGIEPELANVVDGAATARRLIDELGSARLRIVLDPANLFERADLAEQHRLVSEATDLLADRLAMGHAKDRIPDGGFTRAGRGVLDYPHYLACLKAAGFHGPIVAHGLGAEDAGEVAAFLRAAFDRAGIPVEP